MSFLLIDENWSVYRKFIKENLFDNWESLVIFMDLLAQVNEVLVPGIFIAPCQGESGFHRTSWQQDSVASFQLKR